MVKFCHVTADKITMSHPSRRLFGLMTYVLLGLCMIGAQNAYGTNEAPQSFTLDGQLLQAGTQNPLLDSAAKITVDVLDPSRTCILYEEQQTVNTSATNGYYNIQVGSLSTTDPKRTASDPHNTMAQVYQNTISIAGTSAPGQTCAGGFYTPATGDIRYFRITVTPSATGIADTLSPDTVLSSVPTAIVAQTLGGLDQSSFLQVNTSGGANLSQANLNFLFTGTAYSNLQNVEAGNYLQSSSSGAADLPSYTTASPPTTPTAGSVWYNSTSGTVQYYNGTSTQTLSSGSGVTSVSVSSRLTANGTAAGTITSTGTIDLNSSGVTAGTYPKVTVDAYGRVTAGTTLASTDIPTLTTAGQVSGNAITSGTIGGSTAINTSGNITTAGNVSATNVSANAANFRSITLTNGSSQTETIQPPASITGTPTFTWPGTTGTANQVLMTDGTGNLSWTTVGTGNGTVTSVGLSMPSIFTVTGSPVTTSGTLSATLASETANTVLAAPNGSAGAPTFRSLVAADLPTSGVTAGTYKSVTVDTYGRVTTGTNPTTLAGYGITDSVQDIAGTPGIQTGLDASKPAAPTAGTIYMATDTNKVYQYNGGAWNAMGGSSGGGTVTSVATGTGLTGGPITTSGTISLATPTVSTIGGVEAVTPVAHEWINSISTAGVPSLSQPSFSDLTGSVGAAQMPALTGDVTSTAGSTATTVVGIQGISVNSTAPTTSGQVLRYDTGTSKYVPNFIGMADIRSTVTPTTPFFPNNCNAGQTLTYSSPTDTYVCTNITVAGSNFGSQTANTFFAAPNGSAGTPTFRSIASTDLPTSGVTAGTYKSVTVDTYGRVTTGTNPTTLSGYGITDSVQDIAGTPGIQTGLDASKPASPTAGTIYMATDTNKVYQYNSGAWSLMASAAGAGGTVTSVATGTGLTGGPITTSGTISLATPTASTIGGVESVTAVSHKWINSISTAGVPSLTQPAFTDISGTATTAQLPSSVVLDGGNSAPTTMSIGPLTGYNLRFITNNAQAVNIDASQNVQISPGDLLIGSGALPTDPISIDTAPTASATHALVNLTNTALVGGSASGTYIGANPATAGADFMNYQVNGTSDFKVDSAGNVTATSFTGSGSGLTGVLQSSAVSGTANTISKFTGANAVGNSGVTDNGTTVATSEVVALSPSSTSTGLAVAQTGTGYAATFTGGSVGIGTTSPASMFDVESVSTASTDITFGDSSTGGHKWSIGTAGSSNPGSLPAGSMYLWDNSTGGYGSLRFLIDSSGKVGIGTTTPRGIADIQGGSLLTNPETVNTTTTIDFSKGNIQYTTSSCGAYTLDNLKDGGTYTFVVKGTTSATCTFTAYSDAGVTLLTVHMPPDNGATTAGKQTLFSLLVAGTDVYVAWTPGY